MATVTASKRNAHLLADSAEISGNLVINGTITAPSYNNSNWDTAYGWGNHASQGYATQTYVNNAVSNLVDSAPVTLDTLNELAAALGDDPNFATTVTNSIGTKVSKSGDTMTGVLTMGQNSIRGDLTTNYLNLGTSPTLATVRSLWIRADDDDSANTEFLHLSAGQNVLKVTSTAGGGTDNQKLTYNGNKVFHDAYHPNADKWTTARSHTVTLTGEVTGTATQTVDGTGDRTWTISTTLNNDALNDQFVQQLPDTSSPNYTTPSSRRVNPNTTNPTNEHYAISTFGNDGNVTGQLATHFVDGQAYTRAYNTGWSSWRKIWDSQNFDPATYDNNRFVRKTGDTMSGQLTVNSDIVVTGDLKMNGSDSFIWTPSTTNGFTGFWDQANARVAMRYYNNIGGWGVMGDPESGYALKVYGDTKTEGKFVSKRGVGLTTTIIEDDSTASGRAQVLLDSHYSDLIIASRNANANQHGSTITLATQSTSTNDYAKWVIGQGQYQEGADRLSFAYGVNQTNPHNILGTDNAYAAFQIYSNGKLIAKKFKVEPEGTHGTRMEGISSMAFRSVNDTWASPEYHGIRSTDSNGNWGDDLSINSYHDVNIRVDSNNNNSDGYVRFKNNTATGGGEFFYSGLAGDGIYKSYFNNNVGINISPRADTYRLSMGGHVHMNDNYIHFANEVHFNSGTRFKNSTDSVLLFRANSTSVAQLALQTGTTTRGSLYATSGNEIGLLDEGGNWAIRHTNDQGTRFYTDGNTENAAIGVDLVGGNYGSMVVKSYKSSWAGYSIDNKWVFMSNGTDSGIYNDIDNEWSVNCARNGAVTLYHNGASKVNTLSTGVNVSGHIKQSEVIRPDVHWSSSTTSTGQVRIVIPGTSSQYDMVNIHIDVYEYNSTAGSQIVVSGHNWTSGWYNNRVTVIGGFSKPIRLGRDGSDYYILLGDTTSSWEYGSVHVTKVTTAGYYNVVDWTQGWSISQSTTALTLLQDSGNLNSTTSETLKTRGIARAESFRANEIYVNDTAGQISKITNENNMTIYSDHIIDFKESDANVLTAQFGLNGSGNFAFGGVIDTSYRLRVRGNQKIDSNLDLDGGLTISGSLSRGTWTTSSQYHTGADNIVLKGNSAGISGIFFESEKDGTNINHPSDFGFIQYHSYGTGTSGEANELVIGVSNDADDHVVLNAPNVNGLKFRAGASETDYTVWHSGNLNPSNYLTSYTETDTLQSVCSRGNTTNTDVTVNGLLTATQKSFTIDHPTKEGHKLRYGSLEGPENGVYVRGRLKGTNTIELPEYWKELVHEDSITVNLTPIGKGQDIWVEDFNTTEIVVGGENVNCFYTVYGERKDVEKLITEFKEVE